MQYTTFVIVQLTIYLGLLYTQKAILKLQRKVNKISP